MKKLPRSGLVQRRKSAGREPRETRHEERRVCGSVGFTWCVPGMGMILWGASPLYIIRKEVIFDNFEKY